MKRLTVLSVVAGAVLATAGSAHAATAPAPGRLYGWGENGYGEVGINWITTGTPVNEPTPVSLPADVVQVTSELEFSAALRADGSVWVWGTSQYQHGDRDYPDIAGVPRPLLHTVPGLPPISKVSLGGATVFAVGRDGSLWAWGDGDAGQFGSSTTISMRPVELVTSGVIDVAVASSAAAYLTSDGSVYTAGWNYYGALGNGTTNPRAGFAKAWTPSSITQIAATYQGFAALRSDGWVWTWGEQDGDVETNAGRLPLTVAKPVRIDAPTHITQIAASFSTVLALAKDGTVWSWGSNSLGELGLPYDNWAGGVPDTQTPVHLGLTGITQVVAGTYTSGAIRSDGSLLVWGEDQNDDVSLGVAPRIDALGPHVKPGVTGVTTAAVGLATFVVASSVTVTPHVTVPDLSNGNVPQLLHDHGLVQGSSFSTPDTRYCNRLGQIAGQDPEPGAVVPFGSRVDTTVYVKPSQPCL